MKYEKEILESYTRLEMTPRVTEDGRQVQIECINQVLEAFFDKNKKYVVLNAPTGAGKSVIGAVIADVINHRTKSKNASIILMQNNALTRQYYQTFSKFDKSRYVQLKGANNYTCSALSPDENGQRVTADNCARSHFKRAGLQSVVNEHCANCEFKKLQEYKNVSKNVITNFSYFFVDRQYSKIFTPRDIVIWDEAHTVNDAFSEHNAIYFSKDRINSFVNELSGLNVIDIEIFKAFKRVQQDLINDQINENNYRNYIDILNYAYHAVYEIATGVANSSSTDIKKYTRFSKLAKKYFGLGCKIGDFILYNYEHVFEFVPKTKEASIKPIFVGSMFEKTLSFSPYNLFMSATISKKYMTETLKLDPNDVEFIKMPPTFPAENKQIVYFRPQGLNFNTMKDPKVISALCQNVSNIVNLHVGKYAENGIILTPSFALTETIAETLRKMKLPKLEIFEHHRGQKAEFLIDDFKKKSDKIKLLISPSIYEGVDLPGDLSRYQIIVKAPFPSLGEKRMKYILDNHPSIYSLITIQKLVQGAGRSVRSETDFAYTYLLDANAVRLFNNPLNVWKDEFSVLTVD